MNLDRLNTWNMDDTGGPLDKVSIEEAQQVRLSLFARQKQSSVDNRLEAPLWKHLTVKHRTSITD